MGGRDFGGFVCIDSVHLHDNVVRFYVSAVATSPVFDGGCRWVVSDSVKPGVSMSRVVPGR
jgi:hypothetical protein